MPRKKDVNSTHSPEPRAARRRKEAIAAAGAASGSNDVKPPAAEAEIPEPQARAENSASPQRHAEPQAINAASSPKPLAESRPSDEQIRRRAYEIWQKRGGAHGRDQEDWWQAETELRNVGRKIA